jgi:hypothetical protein
MALPCRTVVTIDIIRRVLPWRTRVGIHDQRNQDLLMQHGSMRGLITVGTSSACAKFVAGGLTGVR